MTGNREGGGEGGPADLFDHLSILYLPPCLPIFLVYQSFICRSCIHPSCAHLHAGDLPISMNILMRESRSDGGDCFHSEQPARPACACIIHIYYILCVRQREREERGRGGEGERLRERRGGEGEGKGERERDRESDGRDRVHCPPQPLSPRRSAGPSAGPSKAGFLSSTRGEPFLSLPFPDLPFLSLPFPSSRRGELRCRDSRPAPPRAARQCTACALI